MNKIAAEDLNQPLLKAASVMRGQQSEISRLRVELGRRDRNDHAQKIASLATERGMMGDSESRDYAQQLVDSGQDLSVVENVISNTAAGFPLGSTLSKPAADDTVHGDDVLTTFLLTEQIPVL